MLPKPQTPVGAHSESPRVARAPLSMLSYHGRARHQEKAPYHDQQTVMIDRSCTAVLLTVLKLESKGLHIAGFAGETLDGRHLQITGW